MSSQMTKTLFDDLQEDFCPTLDSSLIAALLVEIECDVDGNSISPSQSQIDTLRATLNELSLQADELQQSEFSDAHLTSQFEETISSWTTPDNATDNLGVLSANTSGTSQSSSHSFGSPLGFLQTALPDVPSSRLKEALDAHDPDEVDLWDIVAGILTDESIREMEERGFDGLGDEDDFTNLDPEDIDWETVQNKRKATVKPTTKKKSHQRPKKIALADIRQQHHIHKHAHRKTMSSSLPASTTPVADPWIQLSSLASQLSTLLPPNPPSTFSSFFHSPDYATSYEAVRAALTTLCKKSVEVEDKHTTILFNLLDIVMPDYDDADSEQRVRVTEDVELAVAVTEGREDDALDIVNLLRDLDSESDMGLTHLPAPPSSGSDLSSLLMRGNAPARPSFSSRRLSGPPDIPPPPSKTKAKSPPPTNKPSPFQWQAIPRKKVVERGPHPLAHHIPAYARDVNGMKQNRNGFGGAGKMTFEATEFRQRMNQAMAKRNRALMDAAAMWKKGSSSNRGGDVALYYAEEARKLQQVAKQEALNAARAMVLSTRAGNGSSDTIDLHGTTVAEAIVIVKEFLSDPSSSISPSKPLKIITGRGTHSVGRVGVLKPAVRKALVEDGWVVGSWDGGLVVRSRRT